MGSHFFEDDWKPRRGAGAPKAATSADDERTQLLACLDGETPVRMLPAISGLPRERVLVLLGELLKEGKVSIPQASAIAAGGDAPPEEPPEEGKDESDPPVTLQRIYQNEIRDLDVDARVAMARIAQGDTLLAITLDPHPRVLSAILDNEVVGLQHARLLAQHHRTATGLEILCRVALFARDAEVQRRLFRNPQFGDELFDRLMRGKQLIESHKLTVSRDVTERVRRAARRNLRARFQAASSDEKVVLILKTDARCLVALVGLSLDGRSVSLLCGRAYSSALLVQNFARWSSTPPPLLLHLSRQKVVLRQKRLFTMLAQHPNAPGQLKKQVFG